MDKKSYRVRNWRDYNEALTNRGSITFWFDDETIKQWRSNQRNGKRGRPEEYSDVAIQCGLTLKALFNLTLRATEGFLKSIIKFLQIELAVPDYTLLCKRQKSISVNLPKNIKNLGKKLHLLFDTTGLKIYGEGEWKVRQHGWSKHRSWRKLHLAINSETQQIEAFEVTDLGTQDCEGLPLLVKQIEGPIGSIKGDGAYDRFSCYEDAERRHYQLITPPQRNAKTSDERKNKVKKVGQNVLKKRDEMIKQIRELGRKKWKIQSGYHRRSLAETAMFRVKTLLGNRLRTRTLEHQKVETAIWCKIINKITLLGMPKTIQV